MKVAKDECRANGNCVMVYAAIAMTIACSGLVWSQVGSGTIDVTIRDQEGGLLPGATARAVNTDSGLHRVVVTDGQGSAAFQALPPGTYTVRVDLDSFAPVRKEGLILRVGQTVRLRIAMKIRVADVIMVVAEAPLIDNHKTDSSTNIVPEQIETLPVADRDFANLALITPGAVRDQITRGYFKGLPVVGGAGSSANSSVFIDGVDLSDPGTGLPRIRFSQDSIRELRIIKSLFDCEVGGSTAGAMSIVTKTGGNEVHGSAFGFIRADSLRAQGEFEQDKLDYQRYQAGFTLGGAIATDKTHYFVSLEYIDEQDISPFRPGGAFAELAEDLENPFNQTLALLNLDHQLDHSISVTAKLAYEQYREENYEAGGVADLSNAFLLGRDNWNLNLGLTWILHDGAGLNQTHLQYGQRDFQHIINSHDVGEWFSNGQTLQTGAHFFGDFIAKGEFWELRNTFHSHLTGNGDVHDLKLGLSLFHIKDILDIELFQEGLIIYANDDRTMPLIYSYGVGSGAASAKRNILGLFVQDEWRPNANFTLSFGIRYDYDRNGNNPDFSHPLTGDRNPDADNLQPRIGFSWDITGNGVSVLRGGGGIFTGRYMTQPMIYELQRNGVTGRILYSNINGALIGLPPEYWLDPSDPENTGIRLPPDITLLQDSLEAPESLQLSVGFAHRLGNTGLHLDTEAIYVEGDKEIVIHDTNFGGNANPVRINPEYNQIDMFTNSGYSRYKALIFSINGILGDGHLITGSVTIADKKNIVDDFDRVPFPSDPADVDSEWGRGRTDEKLRIVLSGVIRLPSRITLAPIYEYSSGPPWNTRLGYDYNGDGRTSDRPPGVSRNSEDGPSFQQLSLRMTKAIPLADSSQLELIVEVFNVFDHTNYDVTSVDSGKYFMGPTLANPDLPYVENPDYGRYRATYPPREIQIGLRIRF